MAPASSCHIYHYSMNIGKNLHVQGNVNLQKDGKVSANVIAIYLQNFLNNVTLIVVRPQQNN